MYTKNDIIKLAKRYNNAKRSYLLVNPIQAKHCPVSPSVSFAMMDELGAILKLRYPDAGIIIGFAETATAIAARVAESFPGALYLQTTRESFLDDGEYLIFAEEHSHAVEQKIRRAPLEEALKKTNTVILIDDEISTGKTMINIVERIRREIGAAANAKFVCASIVNRVSPENIEKMRLAGIECDQLLKIPSEDYESAVADFCVSAPTESCSLPSSNKNIKTHTLPFVRDPRAGVVSKDYYSECYATAESIADTINAEVSGSVLVLGTEECMYPALILGQVLEQRSKSVSVRCHATTRSPIGVLDSEGYPVRNGYAIHSMYEKDRRTYIYNVQKYDTVIILTDAPAASDKGIQDLVNILSLHGCENFILLRR